MAIARDKFWMFGVRAHQDDIWLAQTCGRPMEDRDRVWSRITAAEGAFMLDIPNMLMINCDGIPVPFSQDAYGYAESFKRLDKVMWGVTGSGGFRVGNEEQFICKLAEKYPNIGGAFMDDVFGKFTKLPEDERIGKCAEYMKVIRDGLDKACRPMELYTVWYTHEMWAAVPEIFDMIDGISMWTWHCEELPQMSERFEILEKTFPKHKKFLGVYMYDFPSRKPVPLDLMEHQCEYGLKLLKEGRLDGMIFEANSVMGVGLPSEKWLTEWIDKVKNTEIPG